MLVNHIPTVKFLLPSVEKEAGVFTYFFSTRASSDNWKKIIFKCHSELEKIVNDCVDEDEIYKQCCRYVRKVRLENKVAIEKSLKENEEIWRPIEKDYLQNLSTHFGTEYPKTRKVINAYVSIVPIYPRDIDKWCFNVSYFRPEKVKEIACHEIQHFLYFKKWMEVFPKTKLEERNHPHLVWRLSELIDPVILNEHPEFKKIFTKKQNTYKHFQKIRIKGRQPTTHLAIIYRRHLKSGLPFENFLREIWKFAKDNEKVIMNA